MSPARKRQRLSANEETIESHENADVTVSNDEQTTDVVIKEHAVEQPATQPGKSLFVRGLANNVTSEKLSDFFSETYPVKHAVAVVDPATKECRGYGFVTFADTDDAQGAKQEYNGKQFEGRKLRIEIAEARDREDKTGPKAQARAQAKAQRELEKSQEQQASRLIVRNLPWTIKKDGQLAALFNKYGKVKQAYIPKRKGGLLPGFGFVAMRSRKHAEKAIQGENGKEVDGRTIAVDWAVKKEVYTQLQSNEEQAAAGEEQEIADANANEDMDDASDLPESDGDEEGSNGGVSVDEEDTDEEDESDLEANKLEDRSATLFIRNIPFTCTDEDLEDHFSTFGSVRYARIVLDRETERPKGTGFVAFRSKADAETCLREAPSKISPTFKHKQDHADTAQSTAPSVLQNPESDPSGKYTMDGRVLQLSKAVDKTEARKMTEEGQANRNKRNTDKRRLYLLSEGTIPSNSSLWQSLPPSEQTMREASLKQRKKLIESNPSLHFSLTRLSVRNIPRGIGSKELKAMARQAVVGFATDIKEGKRQKLSDEELFRGGEEMRDAERARKEAGKGVVKQAKVVFETEGGSKVDEASGAGRSRGYGFIEYYTHRNALMGLRWLNGHTIGYQVKDPQAKLDREALQDRKKRLIVEFAIENAQVVHRRAEREQKSKDRSGIFSKPEPGKDDQKSARDSLPTKSSKRKRGDRQSDTAVAGPVKPVVDDKVAQRNRIIGKKRAMRREKRGQK